MCVCVCVYVSRFACMSWSVKEENKLVSVSESKGVPSVSQCLFAGCESLTLKIIDWQCYCQVEMNGMMM